MDVCVCMCAEEISQSVRGCVCVLKPHLFFMAWPAEIVIALPQNRQSDRQKDGQILEQTGRQTDRQSNREGSTWASRQ